MPTISVPIILRNALHLDYPVERVIQSVDGLADEVVLSVDPSSDDFTPEFAVRMSEKYGFVRVIENQWNLKNINNEGSEFSVQTNIALSECEGDWILLLQADEAVHEKDFQTIKEHIESEEFDAYSMLRLYFYGDIDTIRADWSHKIVRLFRAGTRWSVGDAFNTTGSDKIGDSPAFLYHYSRIGDPDTISKRILSLDRLFHKRKDLLSESELEPYDFETYNFDCMHRPNVDVGREKVETPELIKFTGTHPKSFVGYR